MTPDLGLALAIDVAVKAAALGLSLYPMVRPGASHFAGKAMGFRAVAYPPFLVLIPIAWLLSGRPGRYPFLADVLLGIPFLVDVLLGIPFLVDAAANVFGWFAVKRFDIVPHLSGWFCLSTAFGLAIAPLAGERWIAFGLVLGFGAVIDITWEIGEFLLSRSGASGLQLTYENTIQDLGMSLAGAAVGAVAVATVLWPTGGTPATPFGWA